jgi:hypothetical protein
VSAAAIDMLDGSDLQNHVGARQSQSKTARGYLITQDEVGRIAFLEDDILSSRILPESTNVDLSGRFMQTP